MKASDDALAYDDPVAIEDFLDEVEQLDDPVRRDRQSPPVPLSELIANVKAEVKDAKRAIDASMGCHAKFSRLDLAMANLARISALCDAIEEQHSE